MFIRFTILLALAFYTSGAFASAEPDESTLKNLTIEQAPNLRRCLEHWSEVINRPQNVAEFLWAADMYSGVMIPLKGGRMLPTPKSDPVLCAAFDKLRKIVDTTIPRAKAIRSKDPWRNLAQSALDKLNYLFGISYRPSSLLPQAQTIVDMLKDGDISEPMAIYNSIFYEASLCESLPSILNRYGKATSPDVQNRLKVLELISKSLWQNFLSPMMATDARTMIGKKTWGKDLGILIDLIENAYRDSDGTLRSSISSEARLELLDLLIANLKTPAAKSALNRVLRKTGKSNVDNDDDIPGGYIADFGMLRGGLNYIIAQQGLAPYAEITDCLATLENPDFVYTEEFHNACLNSLKRKANASSAPDLQCLTLLNAMFGFVVNSDLQDKTKKMFYKRCKIQSKAVLDQMKLISMQMHTEDENEIVSNLSLSATTLLLTLYNYQLEQGDIDAIDQEIVLRHILSGSNFEVVRKLQFLLNYTPRITLDYGNNFFPLFYPGLVDHMYAKVTIEALEALAELNSIVFNKSSKSYQGLQTAPLGRTLHLARVLPLYEAPISQEILDSYDWIAKNINLELNKNDALDRDTALPKLASFLDNIKDTNLGKHHKVRLFLAISMLIKQQQLNINIDDMVMNISFDIELLKASDNPAHQAIAEEMESLQNIINDFHKCGCLSDEHKETVTRILKITSLKEPATMVEDAAGPAEAPRKQHLTRKKDRTKVINPERAAKAALHFEALEARRLAQEAKDAEATAKRAAEKRAEDELLATLAERQMLYEAIRIADEEAKRQAAEEAERVSQADRIAAEKAVRAEVAQRAIEAESEADPKVDETLVADDRQRIETVKSFTQGVERQFAEEAEATSATPAQPAPETAFEYLMRVTHVSLMDQATGDNYFSTGIKFYHWKRRDYALFYLEGSLYYRGWVNRISPITDALHVLAHSEIDISHLTQVMKAICHRVTDLCSSLPDNLFTDAIKTKVSVILAKIS